MAKKKKSERKKSGPAASRASNPKASSPVGREAAGPDGKGRDFEGRRGADPGGASSATAPRADAAWRRRLGRPVDAASLAFFRVAFGLIMAYHCLDYLSHSRIARWYVDPPILFHYPGFSWISPLSQEQMEFFFIALAALASAMAAGFFYRAASAIFFLGYTYIFLLDAARYNNHEYLICLLAFLMIFLPSGAARGLRASFAAGRTVPAWGVDLMRFQVGVPYFFGGLAKLNYDWLVRGEPIGLWLREGPAESALDLPFFRGQQAGHFFAWGGTVFDLLIVPALLWPRTRPWAYGAAVAFHLANSQLFVIGIFPWMMIALTTVYFGPSWPRRLAVRFGSGKPSAGAKASSPASSPAFSPVSAPLAAALALWIASQALLPFRHLAISGHVDWTEEGHRYAWRMKLRHKEGQIRFRVRDGASGRVTVYENFAGVLSTVQQRMMLHDPEMVRQFTHRLRERLEEQGMTRPEIRVESSIALNGRRPAPMLDPRVDLASAPAAPWGSAPWILPIDLESSLP
ncbi:MAG: HTTM domain-containing protein [Acidobacteriota bacterium]